MPMDHEPLRYAHTEGHTDVCYSEDGQSFVTVGADGDIRIWSIDETEDPVHNCVGEWALSVRQKGNKIYVATSSNEIQILSLPDGDRDGVLDRFVAPINQIAFNKNSSMVALAGEDMEIKLMDTDRSNGDVKIFAGLTGPCLSVALSPDTKFIAASSGDCHLRVWDVETSSLLKEINCFPKVNSFANADILCRIDFEPVHGKYLAYPDKETVVLLESDGWTQRATLSCDEVSSAAFTIVQFSPCGKYIVGATVEGHFVIWQVATEEVVEFSKHAKSMAICGLMWSPSGNGDIVYTDIEGQLSIISGCTKAVPLENGVEDQFNENAVNFDNVQFEDDDDDNENAVSLEKLKSQYMNEPEDELMKLDTASSRASSPRPRTPQIPLQTPFMPSSTPEHLDPRYLCWNDVGVIRSYGSSADVETASKSIEVEFHDCTFHNSMMVSNYLEYNMATISRAALVVANSSQISVIPLSASSKEWMLKVEEHEEIVVIAASENLVALAMSNYLVKICTIFGTQRAVVSIPGPIVSMTAYKNLLLVAHHSAGVRNGDQCINIKLIKFEGTSIESKDIASSLGPESTLNWVGFSDVGTPAMMDSLGMLSLFPYGANIWIPFCDTTKHRTNPGDSFFVTTVFESNQALGGIKCRGTLFPGFTPRPTMCELALEPPFAEQSTDKSKLEMNLFTWTTLKIENTDKKYKETALKTFALACRNDLDQRAIELMEILSNPQVLTLGIKYATKLDKRRLAEKLMEIAAKITNEEVVEEPEEIPKVTKPVYRKLSLKATPRNKLVKPEVETSTSVTEISTFDVVLNESNTSGIIDTQESLFKQEEPRNPFLKNLKMSKIQSPNPLSLTDKSAGIIYEKENKRNLEGAEKRKAVELTEKPKEKQRKLDKMFTKSS